MTPLCIALLSNIPKEIPFQETFRFEVVYLLLKFILSFLRQKTKFKLKVLSEKSTPYIWYTCSMNSIMHKVLQVLQLQNLALRIMASLCVTSEQHWNWTNTVSLLWSHYIFCESFTAQYFVGSSLDTAYKSGTRISTWWYIRNNEEEFCCTEKSETNLQLLLKWETNFSE